MFPLQQKDELVFGTTTNNNTIIITPPDNISAQDLIHVDHQLSNNISFSNSGTSVIKKQTRMKFRAGEREEEIKGNENDIRRVMHRDYERQRRKQMSTRLASLRNLLPPEHIKGKRSLSDHTQEAVNYIKQLEKNVEELRIRRDKLKKPPNSESSNGRESMPNCVTVNHDGNGIEILITCSGEISEFRLSDVIIELLGRNINVVSCVSTKNTGMSLCKIQAEASDGSLIDLSTLQDRLRDVINA